MEKLNTYITPRLVLSENNWGVSLKAKPHEFEIDDKCLVVEFKFLFKFIDEDTKITQYYKPIVLFDERYNCAILTNLRSKNYPGMAERPSKIAISCESLEEFHENIHEYLAVYMASWALAITQNPNKLRIVG